MACCINGNKRNRTIRLAVLALNLCVKHNQINTICSNGHNDIFFKSKLIIKELMVALSLRKLKGVTPVWRVEFHQRSKLNSPVHYSTPLICFKGNNVSISGERSCHNRRSITVIIIILSGCKKKPVGGPLDAPVILVRPFFDMMLIIDDFLMRLRVDHGGPRSSFTSFEKSTKKKNHKR